MQVASKIHSPDHIDTIDNRYRAVILVFLRVLGQADDHALSTVQLEAD